jgi:hypothetical protein
MKFEVIFDDHDFAAQIARRANLARVHVGLNDRVRALRFVLDAPELEGSGFWQCEDGADGLVATLYGAPADLLSEQSPYTRHHRSVASATIDLDLLRVDRWLHRNLLQLDDLLCGRVDPARTPEGQSAAMQSCWDVWTDGRLRAWQHPGLSLAERRAAFIRTFSRSTPLLPRHWAVFHRLWEGSLNGHDGLVRAVDSLPVLRV